jgi:hypothetical protein
MTVFKDLAERLLADGFEPQIVASIIQATALDELSKALRECFGVDDSGKRYLEYLGMAISSASGGSPGDNLCEAIRSLKTDE